MTTAPTNNPTGHLDDLISQANKAGAEGIWLIRGATNARLLYDAANIQQPHLPSADASINVTINLDIADTGVLVIMRLPDDGGEPGIEAH